ncbi:YadA C-terminal domain-containing protein [Pasteurella multocida]
MADLKDDIFENAESIARNKNNIESNSNNILKNQKDILKNKKNIETNTRSIHENRGRIDINTKSIMENREIITESSKEISDNRELIGKNIQDIYKNKEMMMRIADKNAKAISANSKMIEEMRSSFNTRLNHLKRDLKRGLATQSALNGLFQPYSVGKFNLTAAFGGYQSQTAIAIGTGYRFNERIAAKAGIAKSVKGAALSYNVGVNYEF